MKTYSGVLSGMSLNRNTWKNLKNVEIGKKTYLQPPSLLLLLSLLVHHLGQQDRDLLCSLLHPAVHVSLQGQHHFSDTSSGVVSSECQQQARPLSCGHEPNSALRVLESGVGGSGEWAHGDRCTLTFIIRFFPAKFCFCSY